MQMVIRLFVYLAVALAAFVLFAPKKELYYLLEKRLEKSHVVLTDETVRETPFGLILEHPKILLNGAELADVNRTELTATLFYNTLKIQGFRPATGMEKIVPVSLKEGMAVHSLIHPTRIDLNLRGSFGTAVGSLELLPPRTLHLEITEEGDLEALRPYLKKVKGRWIYETRL
jgi:hypothetical protein